MAVHQFLWGNDNQSDGLGLRNLDEQGEYEITLVLYRESLRTRI